MTAQIIDGKAIADKVRSQVAEEVKQFRDKTGVQPGLATVLVGDNPASATYVRSKQKACEELGMRSVGHHLPADATQEQVEGLVRSLGADPAVHGILVQLPLPGQINEEAVLGAVPIDKDVDGFHPVNIGRLAMKGRKPIFVPCTPAGCIVLLDEMGVPIKGANAVVVGRSNIVGKPIANMLLQKAKGANATVTVCHTRTKDIAAHTRRADILIVAAGFPNAVTGDMVKEGAVVIDVGVNRVGEKPSKDNPGKMVPMLKGDVDFDAVKEKASAITPVPGGVGPMTITMLMLNTLKGAKG